MMMMMMIDHERTATQPASQSKNQPQRTNHKARTHARACDDDWQCTIGSVLSCSVGGCWLWLVLVLAVLPLTGSMVPGGCIWKRKYI
jgi:hypothetical protein